MHNEILPAAEGNECRANLGEQQAAEVTRGTRTDIANVTGSTEANNSVFPVQQNGCVFIRGEWFCYPSVYLTRCGLERKELEPVKSRIENRAHRGEITREHARLRDAQRTVYRKGDVDACAGEVVRDFVPLDPTEDVDDDEINIDAAADVAKYEAMGINPFKPTEARPGSEEKILLLSARYAAGVPFWHPRDCIDHGPTESELMGAITPTPPLSPEDTDEMD